MNDEDFRSYENERLFSRRLVCHATVGSTGMILAPNHLDETDSAYTIQSIHSGRTTATKSNVHFMSLTRAHPHHQSSDSWYYRVASMVVALP